MVLLIVIVNNMSYFKNHKKIMYLFGGIIILLAIIVPRVFSKNQTENIAHEYKPLVSLISVDDYIGDIRQIDTDATIESKNQVEIRAQISAPVQSVKVGIGDKVYAGQILLTLKNDDIYAQVAQARANLDSAKTRLIEAQKGTRQEELAIYEQQFQNAERDISNAIRDAYTKIEDAIRNKTDLLYTNPGSINPEIIVRTPSLSVKSDIKLKRIIMAEKMSVWKNIFSTDKNISSDEVKKIEEIIVYAKSYFDALSYITDDLNVGNSGIPQNEIDAYRYAVNQAQSQVNGASSAFSLAISAWKIAGDNLNLRKSGSTVEQLALAQAAVSQAEAVYQGAQSTYNKSVIQSPISGIVSVLPYRLGDLVSPGAVIASVVNNGSLDLKGYISSDDTSYVKIGDKTIIDDKYNGEVSRISPSIDPKTKKVEVKIAVNDSGSDLIVGDIVHVKIFSKKDYISTTTKTNKEYTLPISAINISNSGSFVYTIADNNIDESNLDLASSSVTYSNKVIAHEVKTGEIFGESIKVIDGIYEGMKIIVPVIGLKDGSVIEITKESSI